MQSAERRGAPGTPMPGAEDSQSVPVVNADERPRSLRTSFLVPSEQPGRRRRAKPIMAEPNALDGEEGKDQTLYV
jgi:hypothetical protein